MNRLVSKISEKRLLRLLFQVASVIGFLAVMFVGDGYLKLFFLFVFIAFSIPLVALRVKERPGLISGKISSTLNDVNKNTDV